VALVTFLLLSGSRSNIVSLTSKMGETQNAAGVVVEHVNGYVRILLLE